MIVLIPATINPPAGNPFINNTASRGDLKTPTNIVWFIGSIPTPFHPKNPATTDPKFSAFMM